MQGVRIFSAKRFHSTATNHQVSSIQTPISTQGSTQVAKGAPLNQILGKTFDQKVEQYEHRDFLRIPFTNVRWTYLETKAKVDMYAEGFGDMLWRKKGHRVAFALPEGAENVILQISTAKIGTVFTLLKHNPNAQELTELLDYLKPTGLIWRPNTIHQQLWEDMKLIVPEFDVYPFQYRKGPWWCARFPGLRDVIQADHRPIIEAGFITLRDMRENNNITSSIIPKIAATIQPEDAVAIYAHISDNKIQAKSYNHNDFSATANRVGEILGLEPGDRVCLSVPLQEELAHAIGIWSAFVHGAFVVIPSEFYEPEVHLKTIVDEFCNVLIVSPAYASDFLKNANLKKYNLSKLKKILVVSETVPVELIQQLKDLHVNVATFNPKEKAKGVELSPFKV